MLVNECEQADVKFKLGTRVTSVKKNEDFSIATSGGEYNCQSLVIATGGLSIPPIGATGFGYEIAKQFGLKLVEPQPALVGFNFGKKDRPKFVDLAGVSIDSVVASNGTSFRENILFTHTGLSGPAILQASLYWDQNDSISIDVMPETDLFALLKHRKDSGTRTELKNVLADILPKRFSEIWCQLYFPSRPLADIPDVQLQVLAEKLNAWQITPGGSVGYQKAEVTRGGVDTNELSSKTMESKKVPGLFFIGEVVDVTGQLGGYNFQWAWASAFACAQAV